MIAWNTPPAGPSGSGICRHCGAIILEKRSLFGYRLIHPWSRSVWCWPAKFSFTRAARYMPPGKG
jgi:hypothetical protein